MTKPNDLIAALRIPMNVTLPGAPELDEYDEQRKAAADSLEAVWAKAYRRGQEDMRERAADYIEFSPTGHLRSVDAYAIRAIPIKEKDNG